ncbi:MAG: alpha/beta hydrolase [Nocardioidaceae bacterium]
MPLIHGPDGPIECVVTGSGSPVTAFAHGLAGSIEETRPFGSGVVGTRVFFHFRGHGATVGSEAPWTYATLESELRAVMSSYDVRRGLGVSLGAGALLRAAAATPEAFQRLVFVLPATIDQPRTDPAITRMQMMAELIEDRDIDGLARALVEEQPVSVQDRPDVKLWAQRQARRLSATTVARGLRELPPQHPLESRDGLADIDCPVLVIGQEDDAAHPAALARELAEALPHAEVEIFSVGGVLWTHRAELRSRIAHFLNP